MSESNAPLTPAASRSAPTTTSLHNPFDSPTVSDSDPLDKSSSTSPTIESVFGSQSTPPKTRRHSVIFHISPPTTPHEPHTQPLAVITTPETKCLSTKKRNARNAGLTVRPLIRRVPPAEIAALILKSPRKGQIAAQFHALETHFTFFRRYHHDLVNENSALSEELKAAQLKLEQHSDLPQETTKLQIELAQANLELANARKYLAGLCEFIEEGWAKREPSEASTII